MAGPTDRFDHATHAETPRTHWSFAGAGSTNSHERPPRYRASSLRSMTPLATRNQLTLVRMPDRRNHCAREGLRRVVSGHFANRELVITATGAGKRFQLPLPLCERLLEELVSAGALTRSAGAYSSSGQRMWLVPPLTRPEDTR